MILAVRILLAACCFAPVLAWASSGSEAAAWICGIAGGGAAYGTRLVVVKKGSDARS